VSVSSRVFAALVYAALVAGSARAQTSSSPIASRWRFAVAPYAWMPSSDTRAGLAGEVRRDRWVILGDAMYAPSATGPFGLSHHETIVHPAAGYTFAGATWSVDLLGGFRYWHVSDAREWIDASGGLRLQWTPVEYVYFTASGDGGGGGSQSSWQGDVSLGIEILSMFRVDLGLRALSVDYDSRGFPFNRNTSGATLGLALHF
jgi:hypothetical protein